MQKRVLDYERHPPKRRRSGAAQLWRGRRLIGLVVLLGMLALPAFVLISALLNSYVALGLLVLVVAGAPASWYLDGRRRRVVLGTLVAGVIVVVAAVHVTSLNTIHVQNDSDRWLVRLSVTNEDLRGVGLSPIPPGGEATFHFRSLMFHGRILVFGRLDDDTSISSSLSELEQLSRGQSPPPPARFFRSYVHVRVAEAGELELRTRRED